MIVGGFVFTYIFNHAPLFQYFIEALFKVVDLPGSVVLMMPLAYSFGSWVGFLVYWFLFHREFKNFTRPVLATTFQSFAASIILGFVTYKYLDIFDELFDINTFWGIFSQGLFSGLIGIFCGFIMLKLLCNKEIEEMWQALHKKIWKAKVIGPDPEVQ